MSSRLRRLTAAALPLVALASLTACVGGGNGHEIGSEPPSSFTAPEWAVPAEPVGEWLTSVASDDVRIDVYQAGVKPSTENSAWAYSDTDEPIFTAGEPVVVLHLVLTNTGEEDVVMNSGTPEMTANYDSLDLSSLPPETHFGDIVASLGIPEDAPIDFTYSVDNNHQGVDGDSWNMPVGPGESVAWPAVYMYLTDAGFTLRVRVWTYVNGQYDFSSTIFDSGDVDIPLV